MAEKDSIQWDVHSDLDKLQVRIRSAERNVRDLNPLFRMIENRYIDYMSRGFATEGLSMGKPWKKLSANYIIWKRAHGYPSDIGVMTGKMRSSLTGGAGYTRHIGKVKATFGQLHGFAPWTKKFSSKRPITVSAAEKRRWSQLAKSYMIAQASPIVHKNSHRETLSSGVTASYSQSGAATSFRDPKEGAARRAKMRSRSTGWGERL